MHREYGLHIKIDLGYKNPHYLGLEASGQVLL